MKHAPAWGKQPSSQASVENKSTNAISSPRQLNSFILFPNSSAFLPSFFPAFGLSRPPIVRFSCPLHPGYTPFRTSPLPGSLVECKASVNPTRRQTKQNRTDANRQSESLSFLFSLRSSNVHAIGKGKWRRCGMGIHGMKRFETKEMNIPDHREPKNTKGGRRERSQDSEWAWEAEKKRDFSGRR